MKEINALIKQARDEGWTELDLRGTQISDATPLASLTALTTLYLSSAQISDATLVASLTALISLDLRGSPMRRL